MNLFAWVDSREYLGVGVLTWTAARSSLGWRAAACRFTQAWLGVLSHKNLLSWAFYSARGSISHTARGFISHKFISKSFCKSQFPHKSSNSFVILVIVKDEFSDLWKS